MELCTKAHFRHSVTRLTQDAARDDPGSWKADVNAGRDLPSSDVDTLPETSES